VVDARSILKGIEATLNVGQLNLRGLEPGRPPVATG